MLVVDVADKAAAEFVDVVLDRRHCVYRYALVASSEARIDIVLTAHDRARKALARTDSFNIHYRNVAGADGLQTELRTLVRAFITAVTERDDGKLMLDERKGLAGPEAFRRARDARFDRVSWQQKASEPS